MPGYKRQATDVLTVVDTHNEFEQISRAFNSTSGHNHDGTEGNGPKLNIADAIEGIVPVSKGGTGTNSLASNSVLVGNDTNPVTTVSLPSGNLVGTLAIQSLVSKTIDGSLNTVLNLGLNAFVENAIVTEGEGLNSSDNDTSIPTTAAVKDYVDNNSGIGDMLSTTYDSANISEQLVGLTAVQTLTNKTLTTPTLVLKQSANPTPTAEGDIQWDINNKLVVGDGSGQKIFSDDSYNSTTFAPVSHTHPMSDIVSGVLAHERGGLEADVSTYNGLVKIAGGTTSAVTAPESAIVGVSDTQTLSNKTISASSNTISNLSTSNFAASTLVTKGEGLNSSDNDTSIPTTAAVKDYVDNMAGGGSDMSFVFAAIGGI